MLILIEGGFASVAHDELIKKIKNSLSCGRRAFLIVPEQQTLTREEEMCDTLEPSSTLSFEVTNFTRFTNTAFRTLGGISGEYITSAKRSLVMWGVLTELSPLLTMTGGAKVISSGVVTKALSAIGEMQSLGIKPEDIETTEKMLGGTDTGLKSKMHDLSLIYSLYKSKLGEKYGDMTEDIAGLASKLYESPDYLKDTDVYIEGFTSFTEPQLTLIEAMISLAPVTVSLAIPKAGRDGFEFLEIRQTEERLIRIAGASSTDIKLLKLDAKSQSYNPVISEIADLIWRIDGKIDNDSLQNSDIVRVFEAITPFDECDFIASDIKQRVMSGAKWRDFAIIARNTAAYSGILDSALEKAGVPHFVSEKKSILSFEAIKLICTAYSVIVGGFSGADVMTYAKCGLAGISREECDLFELYVSKWKIEGERFTDGMLWNMNPDGYTEASESTAEKLIRINEIKEKLIAPLSALRDNVRAAKTVKEQADALVDFLLEIGLDKRLTERAGELARLGENEAAEQNLRLWQIICASLDTVVEILGATPADAESFFNQLLVVFTDTGIGSIPSYIDEVSIGQADMARLGGKKHVYLIGVNQGEFPLTVNDTSYFTDRDKLALAELGLSIAPDLEIKNARELYSFSRAFCVAEESVTLLYTKKTASLGAALPSEVIERIADVTGDAVTPRLISEIPTEDKIYSPIRALEEMGKATPEGKEAIKRALSDTEYGELLKISEGRLENDEVTVDSEALGIIIGKNLYLSQSKIDKYLRCPFKFFASSYLKLKETESAEINQLVVGNFIHAVLEGFFGRIIGEGRSAAELSESERTKLTEECAERYVKTALGGGYNSARTDVIISRVSRVAKPIVDGLCDEFANCRFTPAFCEMHIDSYTKDTPSSVTYDTRDGKHKIIIDGYIDRVDTLKVGDDVYVRVVDYKTGIKKFSLSDIEKGENLQMLLYLKAIVETAEASFKERLGVRDDGKIIPAGIVYVKTSVADITVDRPSDELAVSEVKSSFERLGASLDDEVSLSAMNPDYIPVEKSRKGDVSPLTYTREEWDALGDQMREVILDVTDEITSGRVRVTDKGDKSPFSPCTDCQFKYLCRSSGS